MASEELTLREVFLADAYEEHVAHLNKRLAERDTLLREAAKRLEEISGPCECVSGDLITRIHEALGAP